MAAACLTTFSHFAPCWGSSSRPAFWISKTAAYTHSTSREITCLENLIAAKLDIDLIGAHWTDIPRIAASIRAGQVTASVIMRQLAAYPRQNGVAMALREFGRMERTLFTSIGSRTLNCDAGVRTRAGLRTGQTSYQPSI